MGQERCYIKCSGVGVVKQSYIKQWPNNVIEFNMEMKHIQFYFSVTRGKHAVYGWW